MLLANVLQPLGGQRNLMLALPLLFVGIVARFPAGLAVYWITTSLWTLGQQLCLWRLTPAGVPATPALAVEQAAPAGPAARPGRGQIFIPQTRKRKRKHGRRS